MTKDELYNTIACGDITFVFNKKEYYIGDTKNGWVAYELPDGKEFGPYMKYDDLLNEFVVEDRPLSEILSEVTDF